MKNRHATTKPISSSIIATAELWKRLEIGTGVVRTKDLIEQGADLASLNQSGLTPIEFAAYNEQWHEVIQIASTKNTDEKDSYHYSAVLDEAIKKNKFDLIQILLSANAKIKNINRIIDEEGYTLLHEAVILEMHNLVDILIKLGADVTIKNKNNKTPLQLISSSLKCLAPFLSLNPCPEEFKNFNYYLEFTINALRNNLYNNENI